MRKNMKKILIGLICSGLLLQNTVPITASIIQETNEIQEIEQESLQIDNQKNSIESDDTSLDINELENIETDVIEEDFIEIDEQADNTNFSVIESEDNELARELIVEERNEVKNTIYGGRISYFRTENGMLFYDGYGYLQGIEIPNKEDVIHKIKFVDASTGKQVQTFNLNHYISSYVTNDPNHGNGIYNYDWAKFKGYFDVSTLPVGTYNIKVYINAKGVTYDEIIPFHSSINDFSIRIGMKMFNFQRVKVKGINSLQLTVSQINDDAKEDLHIKRISKLSNQGNRLYIDGYSYVKYININNKKDIIQKLKFINPKTGKQVLTFDLPNYYSTAVSNDSNHGNKIYNYDWAKFKGTINISDLPVGEYYMKIYTNAKGQAYDEIINVHSSISNFSYEGSCKKFNFERIVVDGVSTLKLTVTEKTCATVVLDPGHGGTDSGALGSGFKEKDLNLDIAKSAAQYLREKGVTVYMTRDYDKTMSLAERSSFINNINPNLAVSIHNDANINGANGAHVIYSHWHKDGGPGKTLAQNILDSVVANTNQEANGRGIWYRLHPNNSSWDYYHMIREVYKPTVIIECAFMNSADITSLEPEDEIQSYAVDTPDKRVQMGIAIAKGILKTLGINY